MTGKLSKWPLPYGSNISAFKVDDAQQGGEGTAYLATYDEKEAEG